MGTWASRVRGPVVFGVPYDSTVLPQPSAFNKGLGRCTCQKPLTVFGNGKPREAIV